MAMKAPKPTKLFPLLVGRSTIEAVAGEQMIVMVSFPYEEVAKHEKQMLINHEQSVEQVAKRGGLTAAELLAVLEDRKYHAISEANANSQLWDTYLLPIFLEM